MGLRLQMKSDSYITLIIVFLSILLSLLSIQYAEGFILLGFFSLYLFSKHSKLDSTVQVIIWAALFIRIIILLADEFHTFLPAQPDSLQYSIQASRILDNLSQNTPVFYGINPDSAVRSYSFFLSIIYGVLGEFPMLARLINTFLGILTGILVYKICFEIFNEKKIGVVACGFTLLMPSFIAFGSYVLRDAIVLFLTMSMLYHFVLASKRKDVVKNSIIVVITFALISIFRIQNLYLYIIIFSIYLFVIILRRPTGIVRKITLTSLIFITFIMLYFSYGELILSVIRYPFQVQHLRVEGGSAYLQNLHYNNVLDIIKYLPLRFFYFTFGPFIWNANSPFLMLSALEGLLILISAYFSLKYFLSNRISINSNLQIMLLLFCLLGLFANSTVDSNFGTAVRHRMNYVIFFFIFAGAYLRNKRIRFI